MQSDVWIGRVLLVYHDCSQDILAVSLCMATLNFTAAFISHTPLSPTHRDAGVWKRPRLYSAGRYASGAGARGEAGGQRGRRCRHEAEQCAAARGGRGWRAGLQGAERSLALFSGHVPAQVQERRDVVFTAGTPPMCVSFRPFSLGLLIPLHPLSPHLTSGNCCRRPATSRPSSVESWRFSSSLRESSTGEQCTLSSRPWACWSRASLPTPWLPPNHRDFRLPAKRRKLSPNQGKAP
jgi:hypothetical protein